MTKMMSAEDVTVGTIIYIREVAYTVRYIEWDAYQLRYRFYMTSKPKPYSLIATPKPKDICFV